jgi:hypothetical protein
MNHPKYDPNNYRKRNPLIIFNKDYQKIDELFGSALLMIRWQIIDRIKLPQLPLIGTIRARTITPLGELEPHDYQLKVTDKPIPFKPFVHFLSIVNPEFEYSLEINNPTGVAKTSIEIWEYIEPTNYLNQSPIIMPTFQPEDNSAIIAALQANTQAVQQAATPEDLVTPDSVMYKALTGGEQVAFEDSTRRALTIATHVAGIKYRVYVGSGSRPDSFADPSFVTELSGANAQYEALAGECRSEFWVICDTDATDAISVSETKLRPQFNA